MTEVNPLLGRNWVTDGQHWVSRDFADLADAINDYNPTMFLVWIKPEDRKGDEAYPYAVMHEPGAGREPYIIFTLTEEEMKDRAFVIWRIWRGDQAHHDIAKEIQLYEAAEELLKTKRREEEKAERLDFYRSVLKSPLHSYKHNGKSYR